MSINVITTSLGNDVVEVFDFIYGYLQPAFPYRTVVNTSSSSYEEIFYSANGAALRLYRSSSSLNYYTGSYVGGTFTSNGGSYAYEFFYGSSGYTVTVTMIGGGYTHLSFINNYNNRGHSMSLMKLSSRVDGSTRYVVNPTGYITTSYSVTDGAAQGGVTVGIDDGSPSYGKMDANQVFLVPAIIYSSSVNLGFPTVGGFAVYGVLGMSITSNKVYTFGGRKYYSIDSEHVIAL